MFFFKPQWARTLPDYMRPSSSVIAKLERLRKELDIPHDIFAAQVASGSVMTRRIQKHFLEDLRRQLPNSTEKELWVMVLASRVDTYKNMILADISTGDLNSESAKDKFDQLTSIVQKYEDTVGKMRSFDELCDYIISLDEEIIGESYSGLDPLGIRSSIDKLLREDI